MIKYLGSKRLLLERIEGLVRGASGARTVLDLFSGTARVGHALKRAGYRVLANDHNAYAHVLARCYVQADAARWRPAAERLVAELGRLPGDDGWFTQTYCRDSRYFQPKNGARIESIRAEIARKALEPDLEAILIVALLEAADRVDSTTGVQMAYLKAWAPRSSNDLELRVPEVLPGRGEAHRLEAYEAARSLEADVVYVDPPYNQHSYLGNYHVWETLALWDRPEVYGVARKRTDCRLRKSAFNSRPGFAAAMRELLAGIRARTLILSFNDEGYLGRAELERMLGERGEVRVLEHDYRRYVGAKIGIYNPQGKKVGKVGRLRNVEYLFVVDANPRP